MAEQRVIRRLTTILAADVVGYSRLTGADEEGIVSRLRALRQELIDPVIAANGGRTVKLMGDGRLVEFGSVVGAVRCAIEVQSKIAVRNIDVAPDRRIELRVGIHLGDVMVESDGDLMGDGVNIAARLESIAEPGGICLSEDAWRQVRDKVNEQFTDVGDTKLKNIPRPVRVYRMDPRTQLTSAALEPAKPALALPDKPSIAVLPFQNMSDDPGQEYFCDGVVEDIITGLSRIKWLFVIARNTSFAYKGKAVDVRTVGRELGVRYVLEGSVRKASGRVRITGQLIDTTNGAHIWADRFEGTPQDIFELQDRVAASVVGAIDPALRTAELQRALSKSTASLSAYDYYLRGLAAFHLSTPSGTSDALALCRKAIEIDPNYAVAYGLAAFSCLRRRTHGWVKNPDDEREAAMEFATRAIELGANDSEALAMGGVSLPYFGGTMDRAVGVIERSLALNANWALAWASLGMTQGFNGEGTKAIESMERATRLSPLDPEAFTFKAGIAVGHFVEGRYEQAVAWADRSLLERPNWLLPLRIKMASCGLLGRRAEAEQTVRMALAVDSDVTVTKSLRITPFQRPHHRATYAEGLRKAGLPE